ncbi:MAG: lipoate protein ligase C-terminal domain-containing protein [Candidatus Micrarchaeaceae archaeon]
MTNTYATKMGFITVDAEVENNVILSIKISGDFTIKPDDALSLIEKHLSGVELERKFVGNAVGVFYMLGVETPNLIKEDFINAIMGLKEEKKD